MPSSRHQASAPSLRCLYKISHNKQSKCFCCSAHLSLYLHLLRSLGVFALSIVFFQILLLSFPFSELNNPPLCSSTVPREPFPMLRPLLHLENSGVHASSNLYRHCRPLLKMPHSKSLSRGDAGGSTGQNSGL